MNHRITVFTPTYNRGYLLGRCYESLLGQTNQEFEWLIVDDGSTDETRTLVESWQREDRINIRYVWQPNGGKHVAHNTAVKECRTDLILIFDSDDVLHRECIATLYEHVESIADKSVCGIIGNKYYLDERGVIGSVLPEGLTYTTGRELYQIHGLKGDTLRLYKTSILQDYLFPVIDSERFVYENVVFDAIDANYRMLVIRGQLYYCDYLEDGYTANADNVKIRNPIGYSLSLNSSVKYAISPIKKINWTILYIVWCWHAKIHGAYRNFSVKWLYILAYPLALMCNLIKRPSFFFRLIKKLKKLMG